MRIGTKNPINTSTLGWVLFGVVLVSGLLFRLGSDASMDSFILYVNMPLALISLVLPIALYTMNRLEREQERLEQEERETRLQLEQSRHLINSLEAQRHDFRNQLQVISGLATMGRIREIRQYVDECGAALEGVTSLDRISNPAIQAVMLSFHCKARQARVDLEVDCSSDLSRFKYSPVKISRVFANILENALEAAQGAEPPAIHVMIAEDQTGYEFSFWNNGLSIPTEDQGGIFREGFSRKPGEHRGYGLFIAKSLTEEMGGAISFQSDETDGTTFHLWFPRSQGKDRAQPPQTPIKRARSATR